MRPRNREFNILNMSFLDVICGAMGAFLIIMVILMPYYKKEAKDFVQSIGKLRQELAKSSQRLEETETKLGRAEEKSRELEQEHQKAKSKNQELTEKAQSQNQELDKTSQRLEETELELAKVRRELNQQINASLFGLAIREKKIVVLLDLSGSLSEYEDIAGKGNPCIGCVEKLLLSIKEIANKLDETFEIGLIGFHAPPLSYEPLLLYWPAPGKIKSMDNQGKSSFIAEADSLLKNVKGGTPTQDALLRALDYPAHEIILLTDGNPTVPHQDWEDVVEVVTQKNKQRPKLGLKPMVIHTVAVGRYNDNRSFVSFLLDLSTKNNGNYVAKFAPQTP
jgi:F0F1-type ATP synthase membrane subunit b/b'